MTFSDLISVHNPLDQPLHFFGLELVVYACFGLTLAHALRARRGGNAFHLFQWGVLFCYGLVMELVSFNLYQNYAHGTFSVMFYFEQLPLYITCIYLVFHYTGIKVVERLGLPLLPSALLSGLMIFTIDVPFDSLGVNAGWWTWEAAGAGEALHPRFIEAVSTRWFGVPVTSYLWYLMYSALLVVFSRLTFSWLRSRALALVAVAPLVAIAVFVCGALAFEVVFWFPRGLGVSDHIIVATYIAVVVALAALVRAPGAAAAPRTIALIPFVVYGFHVAVFVALGIEGALTDAPGKAALIASAGLVNAAVLFRLPLRRARTAPAGTPQNVGQAAI